MLKKYFLLSIILFALSSFTTINAQNPSIGFILQESQIYDDPEVYSGYRTLYAQIKNTGDEVLNNINIIDNYGILDSVSDCRINGVSISCTSLSLLTLNTNETLETLNPDDVLTLTILINNYGQCDDQIQFEVTADTPNASVINDFSANYSYDYNNTTYVQMNESVTDFQISATYVDDNNNSMVDIGDTMVYTINTYINTFGITSPNDQYTLNATNLYNNETVTVSSTNNTIGDYVTVTYPLNAADIAIGYVYFLPDIFYDVYYDSCNYVNSYSSNNNCFNCPQPDNCDTTIGNSTLQCIKTNLSGILPNKISGNVTFDSDNNSCATGLNFPNRRVTAATSGASFSSFTNQQGEYSIYIPNINTYNTSASINLSSEFTVNPDTYSITSSGSDETYDADFCVSSTNNFTDLKVIIIPMEDAVPGFNSGYKVYAYNQGSTALNGSVTLTYDPVLATVFEQAPISNANTSNSLTWDFSNLIPFQHNIYFVGFTINTPPTVESDDVVTFTATTTQDITDSYPVDNQFELNQIAVNSFDPNDKTILEGPYITQEQSDGYIHFLTRFQNEGTAAAQNIVITESLHYKIDYSTFEPIASSHPADIQIAGNNQLSYTFEGINLPHASADEPASHGWILYKAKLDDYFTSSHIAKSSSNIYFDFNPAIVTSEATTQIGILSTNLFTKDSFKLYPNPATNQLNISAVDSDQYSIAIIDLNGKEVYSDTFSKLKTIDVSSLQSGFYMVSITNKKGRQNYKLIKN
ncbi:DUF7619 domain-containing protein [Lacinutrix algicola]|uniref:DUF7619 domain-containing protein n=1 Tax=Lacinutrix algicola TaxID=342954 RepID=UPI0006E2553E|nr:T9SS type A sorting domain-containing protein [Lacinutrix algicola]